MIKQKVIFTCIAFVLSVAIGVIFSRLYPWIHKTFYPTLSEAEVQTYSAGIIAGVLLLSLWFWISKNARVARFLEILASSLRLPPPASVMIIIPLVGIGSLLATQHALTHHQGIITFFQDMALAPTSFTPAFYVVITLILYLLFALFECLPAGRQVRRVFPGWMFTTLAIVTIILLTFHVGYLNPYDFSLYAGPINDTLHGKPPLSFPSTYGFFVIVFLANIFTIVPLSLFHLHIITAMLTTLGFIAFYVLANALLKNHGVAFLATILAVSANWLTGIGYRATFPQTGILRFGMWYVVALAIYGEVRFRQSPYARIARLVTDFMVALSFFWSFDAGAYIAASYLMFRWFMSLHASIPKTITGFTAHLVHTIGMIIGMILLVMLVSMLRYGVFPQWHYFWGSTSAFLSGPLLLPLPSLIIPWLVLAPLVISICHVLSVIGEQKHNRLDTSDTLLLFTACYGIIQFTYFIGRSHPNNLHHVILPSVLCLFVLCHRLIEKTKSRGAFSASSTFFAVSLFLSYPMTFFTSQAIRSLKSENFITTIQALRAPKRTEQEMFGETARALKHQYPAALAAGDIGILSLYDTWYLVLLKTTNPIGTNALMAYLSPDEVGSLVSRIAARPPNVLAVDKNPYDHAGEVSWVFNKISSLYQWKESVGLLDVYLLR